MAKQGKARERYKHSEDERQNSLFTPGFVDFWDQYIYNRVVLYEKSKRTLLKLRERVYPLAVAEKLTRSRDIHDDFEVLLGEIDSALR